MPAAYAKHFSTRSTPQSQPIPGKQMVANSAGGFAFAVDDWKRLERFLILGNEGGSYYASEKALTIENAQCVTRCLAADAKRTVDTIVAVSDAGRAPKNDPAIFALAICSTSPYALEALPKVCRIGTHLFQFAEAVQAFRGWGRSLRRAVGRWYSQRNPRDLSYQLTKYQQRNGWSHRDLLRLSHPKVEGPADTAIRWAVGKQSEPDMLGVEPLVPILAYEHAQKAETRAEVVRLIREYRLVRECIPTKWLNHADVWEALLEDMPMTALLRNLGKMSNVGLIAPMSNAAGEVLRRFDDVDAIRKSRLHPLAILIAQRTYASGKGVKGKLMWPADSRIIDALDGAFYKAFANVEPTGKRWLLALDVSGSMGTGAIAGTTLSPREATAALALVTANVEQNYAFVAFTSGGWSDGRKSQWAMHGRSNGISTVDISARQRLDDVCRKTAALPMGGTDCALPMLYALDKNIGVDTFVVLTDNETWAGDIHPSQALRKYREQTGIPAKLIVVGMTATQVSIADPTDAGMLDVVGFDASAPAVMADFAR